MALDRRQENKEKTEGERKRILVGISGASGIPVALEVLKGLQEAGVESHLMISRGGELTAGQEAPGSLEEMKALADVVYDNRDIGAAPASGSFRNMGMIVVPCSMKTLAGIHSGYSDSLLLRAADVALKERRKLVLAVRECPFSTIHLRNMYELSSMGAVILPLVLSYYNKPENLQDAARHLAGKILDQFGVEYRPFKRWEGMETDGILQRD